MLNEATFREILLLSLGKVNDLDDENNTTSRPG